MARIRILVVLLVGVLAGLPAWAANPGAGIYVGTFTGPESPGSLGMVVNDDGTSTIFAYFFLTQRGFVSSDVIVGEDGSVDTTDLQDWGARVTGMFDAQGFDGVILDGGDNAIGSLSALRKPTTGNFEAVAGLYLGTLDGSMGINGGRGAPTTGTVTGLIAPDGSGRALFLATGFFGDAHDSCQFSIALADHAITGTSTLNGQCPGQLDFDNAMASGTYSVTYQNTQAETVIHNANWSMAREVPDTGPNTAPVAVADMYDIDSEQATAFNAAAGVLSNDTDADSDPLTAVLQTGPALGSLNLAADGSFDYTPGAAFALSDSFTYLANDGSDDSNVVTVTIQGLDADNDGLADFVERRLGSSTMSADTDGDGESDLAEFLAGRNLLVDEGAIIFGILLAVLGAE